MLAAILVTAAAGDLLAQETEPRKSTIVARPRSSSETAGMVAIPSPPPADNTVRAVVLPGGGASRARDSAGVPALKGVRAREVKESRARLLLASGERTVRPGDAIGTDVITSIEPSRLLLRRALPSGAEATVVVTFDDAGRGRVRVLFSADPSAALTPPVR